jgi:hypothetical protein
MVPSASWFFAIDARPTLDHHAEDVHLVGLGR